MFFVTLALGLLIKFVLSNIQVGEANYINVEVVDIGFDMRLTGRKLVYNTVTADGVSIQIENVFLGIRKPGDSIVLEIRKRLLFLPDVYLFHEKNNTDVRDIRPSENLQKDLLSYRHKHT